MNAAICRRLLLSALILATSVPVAAQVRIIQTNSQGNNIHLIDPATNQIVGEVTGVPINHGAAGAPDGSRLYFSSEAEQSLHVVDGKTLQLTKKIPLSGRPEQHLDQPRRPQGLRRHRFVAGRRRRHRHGHARKSEEHPDEGRHSQRLRDARRQVRRRGIDCRTS